MRLALAICLALAGAAAPAAAGEVRVRSGEHPGFSRLVFAFDRMPRWSLAQSGGSYVLTLDPWPGQIGTARVFDFIPRDRLRALAVDAARGRVRLDLGCDCRVSAFVLRGTDLVLDVADRPAPNRFAVSPRDGGRQPITEFVDGPVTFLAGPPEAELFPLLVRDTERPMRTEPPAPMQSPLAPRFPLSLDRREQDDTALTQVLAEGLARAAAQGLLTAARIQSEEGTPAPPAADPPSAANFRVRTGVDSAIADVAEDLPPVSPDARCLPDAAIDVASWGSAGDAAAQIGERRRALLGEFDVADPGRIRDLARLYLYLSFGQEARSVVAQFPADPETAALVGALADILDGRPVSGSPLARYILCDGHAAFWAVLAHEGPLAGFALPTRRILQTFNGLPPHLRRHLGPTLAERFAALGDGQAVAAITASMARVTDDDDPSVILARTTAASGTGAEGALAAVARSQRPEAAEALVRTVENRLALGETVPPDLVDLLSIFAFELGGTPEGEAVAALEIEARLANGAFRAAFDLLRTRRAADALPPGRATGVSETLLRRLTELASDEAFLAVAFQPEAPDLAAGAAPDALAGVAGRLLDLGFAQRASEFAALLPAPDPELSARLAAATGDLPGLRDLARASDSPAPRRLLARTLSDARDYGAARSLVADLNDDAALGEVAWRGGFWDEVSRGAEGEARPRAARLMLRPPAGLAPGTSPTISAADALMSESAALRDLLGTLLSEEGAALR